MTWNKPKTIWHWLGLVSPGAVSVAMTAFGKTLKSSDQAGPGVLGFPVAFILCLVIAFLLVRGSGNEGKRFGLGVLITIALVIINFTIAFGGCVVIQPHFDMR
ncbi:MAG: hypothetical protein WCH43_09175 [Verrucomicrobiota bacterium]